jgi:hypothetical protein
MSKIYTQHLNPLPREDEDAIVRGERLLDEGRLSLAECEALLKYFAIVRKVVRASLAAVELTANRRGLTSPAVLDACANVAFGYEEVERGLRMFRQFFLAHRGPTVHMPTPEERRIRR